VESRIFENCGRGNHGFVNGCVDRENRVFFNRCGSRGNRDIFNRRGNYNFDLFNPVRHGRSFKDDTFEGLGVAVRNGRRFRDGTFEGLGSVGVNNLEFVRSSDSACFVYNPTVRRRGGVGIQTCYVGPNPRFSRNRYMW